MSSPNPDQRDYAALLIAKATADRHAVHVLAEADIADELVGFHAQQSVEKAVKAVLVLAGARLPRIHDLERLLALASESGSPPPASVAAAGWLTRWGCSFATPKSSSSLTTRRRWPFATQRSRGRRGIRRLSSGAWLRPAR